VMSEKTGLRIKEQGVRQSGVGGRESRNGEEPKNSGE
jgi:hypothetical protein